MTSMTTPQPATIGAYLAQQQDQDLLRFITCGSVDDGKSTLIGRLLWDAQQLTDDQLATLKAESKKHGTQGDGIDFALLVDGLAAEREQGITIDVAYRFFATAKRKFIVADTPGHEQYTRNMVTGASTADMAVILVDARQGVLTQTRRHAYLVSLMGIRHVVLAVNKMDLLGFDATAFEQICADFQTFAGGLGFASITPIPLSALRGDNITQRSPNTPWYAGPTLLGCLETIEVSTAQSERLVFPVQWVNRPDASFRGFSGYLSEGRVSVGDEIRVTRSGQTACVAEIVSMDGPRQQAVCGDAVTLRLDKEIDASRGDILALSQKPLETTDQFEATLVWLHEDAGLIGRSYDIKLATQWASASLTGIKHRVDINTLAHDASKQLALNDISVCTLATSKPLVFDSYRQSRALGGFILVDRMSNATVAAGMITHSMRRAQNVHSQALSVSRPDREKLNGHKGKVIWFTGLSGSGKSTIANALEVELHARGYRTYILDGDNVRQGLNKDLGFTDADRVENIRRIAEVAKLMLDAGLIVMTAFISPFIRERQMARELIGAENFVEVYVSTSLAVCEDRDVKGLYKKARAGQLPNLSGVGSPYEAPPAPDLQINSDTTSLREAIDRLLAEAI
ncbi:sulfate adenylyltransferase subunit CysN [Pseudomonas sp. N040]|uniref:sulfate adenylyltransferase subunit CysN n=1 Tax=Pseudomonas sp. N040 TaxID=2785325 RepID=UPI0018A2D6CD|nr:sulfate adenylyltransferase subunit CysN [Pseudomonas sp. N040]MBF7731015.1 sulfate adenylyltransferase subunit CysN [Pseudomonas sp. N040]MBW7014658.1 sulfate adenylyltransferase subunit CysN [Pseudomonas sp. N040]